MQAPRREKERTSSQDGYVKYKSCLISFCDRVADLVNRGERADIIYPDFSKAFDLVTFKHSPRETRSWWMYHQLENCTQRMVINIPCQSGGQLSREITQRPGSTHWLSLMTQFPGNLCFLYLQGVPSCDQAGAHTLTFKITLSKLGSILGKAGNRFPKMQIPEAMELWESTKKKLWWWGIPSPPPQCPPCRTNGGRNVYVLLKPWPYY